MHVADDPLLGGDGLLGSPWVALGNGLLDTGKYDDVVIALAVKSGTSIEQWRKGGSLNETLADASAQLAMAGMPADIVTWVQGEEERLPSSNYRESSRYAEALSEVIATVRRNAPQSKFYVTQASWCPFDSEHPGPIASIRQAQASVIGGNVLAGPDLDAIRDRADRRDNCHLSEQGLRKFVAAWLRILVP